MWVFTSCIFQSHQCLVQTESSISGPQSNMGTETKEIKSRTMETKVWSFEALEPFWTNTDSQNQKDFCKQQQIGNVFSDSSASGPMIIRNKCPWKRVENSAYNVIQTATKDEMKMLFVPFAGNKFLSAVVLTVTHISINCKPRPFKGSSEHCSSALSEDFLHHEAS